MLLIAADRFVILVTQYDRFDVEQRHGEGEQRDQM